MFWDRVEGTTSRWTNECPFEDRRTFELEIEAMVWSSVPKGWMSCARPMHCVTGQKHLLMRSATWNRRS